MTKKLMTINVLPPFPGHEAELARDAEQLLSRGICTDIGFMMTLVPESDPPVDKAKILGERFLAFRKAFSGDPARLGILAQATIGHGWAPDEPASYQKIIRPDGTPAYQMCPLDMEFQAYIRHTFEHLASLQPAFIMVDDDFRLLTGRNGCYCPLHLAEISRRTGEPFTREILLERLRRDPAVAREYDALLLDSLMDLAGVIRETMDSVDPSIPGSFCACSGDIRHAEPLAQRLVGKGHQRIIRVNNARYLCAEMRSFPVRMVEGAAQIAGLAPDTIILAETDPCPHNRYSAGAHLMHSHYTGSILEGCHGAKHWLTRIYTFQPASGVAYREILTRYNGFYETLFQSVQTSVTAGYVAAALPSSAVFNPAPDHGSVGGSRKSWSAIMGVLGLPCNYARMPDLPAMLTGEDVDLFSDEDLRKLLGNGVLLDGPAAEALTRRGFAEAIGVRATPWTGPGVSGERWGETVLQRDLRYSKLEPINERTRVHSVLLHRPSGVSETVEELGAAVTLFENSLGGRVAVLAASSGVGNSLAAPGLSFYDEDRKRELVELLGFVCGEPIPFYYPGDAEVYLKLRRFADGRYLLAVFNLGHDPLEDIPLVSAQPLAAVEQISPEGDWRDVEFASGSLQTPLLPAQPKVFRLASRVNTGTGLDPESRTGGSP